MVAGTNFPMNFGKLVPSPWFARPEVLSAYRRESTATDSTCLV